MSGEGPLWCLMAGWAQTTARDRICYADIVYVWSLLVGGQELLACVEGEIGIELEFVS